MMQVKSLGAKTCAKCPLNRPPKPSRKTAPNSKSNNMKQLRELTVLALPFACAAIGILILLVMKMIA